MSNVDENLHSKESGVAHLIKAAGWSMAGLRAALDQAAFRQEVLLFVVLAPLAAWLGRSGVERAMLLGSLMLVLVVELLNTAVEATIDRVGAEMHPLSKRAKDLGSAAVFVSIAMVVAVWTLILLG